MGIQSWNGHPRLARAACSAGVTATRIEVWSVESTTVTGPSGDAHDSEISVGRNAARESRRNSRGVFVASPPIAGDIEARARYPFRPSDGRSASLPLDKANARTERSQLAC